ncbi:MAG: hypothetical protein HYS32_00450 [Candidatus Woesearchaeota archaeon]|nr:MAG: hypothetical protein HYS32_00450 [Candidatus Woesearchaeota archaeon]
MKKGDIWISAVLYIGIGIVILVVILSASMPLIRKARDENVISQTRQVMLELDDNIRTVIGEGAGSQRVFSVEIGRGELFINDLNNSISWSLETNAEVAEAGSVVHFGNLDLLNLKQAEGFLVTLSLSYNNTADIINVENKIKGRSDLVIFNNESMPGKLPKIKISSK